MRQIVNFIQYVLQSGMFLRHFFVGAITYILMVFTLHILISAMHWETIWALVVLHCTLFVFGFLLASRFVFGDKNSKYVLTKTSQLVRYGALLFTFRVLDALVSYIFIDWLGISYLVTPLIVTNTFFVIKFFVYRKYVFMLEE